MESIENISIRYEKTTRNYDKLDNNKKTTTFLFPIEWTNWSIEIIWNKL